MATELTRLDQLYWRKHLLTESGVRGMLFLRESAPSVHKGSADEIIFDAGVAEGYRRCLDKINEVIAAKTEKQVDPSND
jgi:hypothetical protein